MYLALTTLAHLSILLIPLHCPSPLTALYPYVIGSTVTVAALWHWNQEPKNFLSTLNHGCTAIWITLDIILALLKRDFTIVVLVAYLNVATFAHHEFQKPFLRDRGTYIYYHSLWHLLSVAKGIAVALLLQCPAYQGGQEIRDMPNNSLVFYEYGICQI
jgi:hypothetical protein